MAVITLTSDWRNSDYYIGAVKGKILSRDAQVNIVDISHQVLPFNSMQAAFILKNCYFEFPSGSVHIIAVNTVLSSKRGLLIIEKDKHYFLCSDSGFPDLLFPEEAKNVYRYSLANSESRLLNGLDAYIEAAIQLISGEAITEIAAPAKNYTQQKPLLPAIDTNLINGSVVYIDSYSNAITNINRETFEQVGKGHDFEIFIQSNHYIIDKISETYLDVPTGELLALFNASGLLEIAISNGPVAQLLDLKVNSIIRIKFNQKSSKNKLLLSGE